MRIGESHQLPAGVTTIDFYTSVADPLRFAAKIVAKAYRSHGSVRVLTADPEATNALDRLLWAEPQQSFLPHCRIASPIASETPILVDDVLEHSGPADVLVNLQPDPPPFFSRFERLAEVVGADEASLAAGRQRYRFYKERGYELRLHDFARHADGA